MTEQPLKDGPTPEAEQHGDYAEVTVVAEDRSMATVKRNRRINPMMALYESGTIDEAQFEAAIEISRVAEEIQRTVGMRSASLEARVDNSGSAKNLLIEQVSRVRLEATYNKWRSRLPMPKRMVIDMVVEERPLFATARRFKLGYPKARNILINALNNWIEIRDEVLREIDEHGVMIAQLRAGGGLIE